VARSLPLPAAPPAREAPPPQEVPVFRIAVGLGVMASPGGLGPAAALDLGVAWMPSEHVGATLFAVIPLSRPDVAGVPGSADLAAGLGGVGARFLLTSRASRWAPTIDAGLAVIGLGSKGVANTGYAGSSVLAATAAPFLRVGLAFAPTPRFRVRADLLGGVVIEGVSIELATHQAATWGTPLGLLSAGVDVGLF
jgi:hypothetical protein